ncbi:hypothetical protein [Bacillus toyonensis]|uniref:hypothetical protein n=1 Tax=Bacillus toyonensis TaxID=155322 RepID=UPI002E1ED319|nr:DUF4411 family protein [Bacillus toyonensis]
MGKKKKYSLDTNVIRYQAAPSIPVAKQTEKNKEQVRLKKATTLFWAKLFQELTNNQAEIILTNEVLRELEIQITTLSNKDSKNVKKVLQTLKMKMGMSNLNYQDALLSPANTTLQAEHHYRELAAYIQNSYKQALVGNDAFKYPAVSDARIQLESWSGSYTLVTANVKEFILYPLLFEYPECNEKLYDLKSSKFKIFKESTVKTVQADNIYKGYIQKIQDALNNVTPGPDILAE